MSERGAWSVTRILDLPGDMDRLVAQSRDQGYGHVVRLRADWLSGANRFDADGEALFATRRGSVLLGICGLNRDPYTRDTSVARIRHLYVAPDSRRLGVGRALVEGAIRHARVRFRGVRLRTHDPGAAVFYDGLGFRRTPPEAEVTHTLWFT